MQKSSGTVARRRIFELDLLRGFFIAVIIINHLQFWPSPFTALTGEGRLWVSAAEGFFLVSGLLIGYVRGYKGVKHSLTTLTKLLWKRAAMLYVWGVAVTLLLVYFTLLAGNHALLPKLPSTDQLSSTSSLLSAVVSGQYFSGWIYFLRLYAIVLLATPLFLYLVRRNQDLIVILLISVAYLASFWIPEGALQWQVFFFGAALIGYRLEYIIDYLRKHRTIRNVVTYGSIVLTATTMTISFFFTHGWSLATDGTGLDLMTRDEFVAIKNTLDPWFTLAPVQIGRIVLAYLWLAGGLFFIHTIKDFIVRWFGWLLFTFGERSLTAYIIQALLLPLVVVTIPLTGDWVLNMLITIAVLLLHWYLMRLPIIEKHLPR